MTDFGRSIQIPDASAANQGTQITAEEAIQAAVETLTCQRSAKPVNAQVFNDVQTTYTSNALATGDCRKILLRVILTVTGTPGTIKISPQFSFGGGTYQNCIQGPFGSLMYEDTAGNKSECIPMECIAPLMRINVVATGTSAANKFTLTCQLVGTR